MVAKLHVRQAIDDPAFTIIDARSNDEFQGHEERWRRHGHIPGAINVEWTQNLRPDGTVDGLKEMKHLKELYRDVVDPDSRVITYCTRGRRAAVSYLALRFAGFNAAVYDGSWTEWSEDFQMPITTPLSSD